MSSTQGSTAMSLAEGLLKRYNELIGELEVLNIMLCGKTGVGKSTLLNAVFGKQLVETGVGRPVTKSINRKDIPGAPLVIYDTPGLELKVEDRERVKKEVMDTINKGLSQKVGAKKDLSGAIHFIWYCINVKAPRIEKEEIEWLRELSDANKVTKVPIIIVLTRCTSKKEAQALKTKIEKERLDVVGIVPVLAKDDEVDIECDIPGYPSGPIRIPSHGLDELIRVTGEVLPRELKGTLLNLQKVCLSEKVKLSQIPIGVAVAAAAAAGASPIPFSQCLVLVPIQCTMITAITAVFGVNPTAGFLTSLISATLGCSTATVLGTTIVELLKFIPGVGTIAGGIISASTAGIITAGMGEAYIKIMTMIFKGEISMKEFESAKGKQLMLEIYKEQLKNPQLLNKYENATEQ